ncbi:MAG: CAAX protease [Candidatus Eremiobacteraeota bacterium]|nr:CAAX protease [Candidatus Eremiobacteraeota bacterium]
MTVAPDTLTTLWGVLGLRPEAFVHELHASEALTVALAVVFIAGLSEAAGQSVVLFANRVKPVRFFFTMAIQAVLFTFGFGFLVLSTWVITRLPHMAAVPLGALALAFALSYVPLCFAFFGALPYAGSPLLLLLRVWHLLAMVVGFSAISGVPVGQAPWYVGLGWLVLATAQHTLGRPIASVGSKILKLAAGVDLQNYDVEVEGAHFAGRSGAATGRTPSQISVNRPEHRNLAAWRGVVGALIALALAATVAVALSPLRGIVLGWDSHVPVLARIPLSLVWIGIIALIVAGLLAPLETLGWWAGWYGGEIDTKHSGIVATSGEAAAEGTARYIVYLDGIAQSRATYTQDTEDFLDALARELPKNMRLIRGIMSYSVINRPLDADPLFSALWRVIDWIRLRNARSVLGMLINLRNVLIVAVSADKRYGPMYNFGIAQTVYDALLANGYRAKTGIPVTLIGYSGGGQMAAAASFMVKRAIDSPVDVISLGGVISGACKITHLEQLYHHAGSKDRVQSLGPILFPTRWKIAVLSNWNRALRLGRISFIPLGPVGHQVPGGIFDPTMRLPDGRTFLRQTLDCVGNIISGHIGSAASTAPEKLSNYARYVEAAWNRPEYYPLSASLNPERYKPAGDWMGRLVLPAENERERVRGAWLEVHHAPPHYRDVVGRLVALRWSDAPATADMVRAVTRDVHFSPKAEYTSRHGGLIQPTRLNGWKLVDPLESLAGARPNDDMVVMLAGPVHVTNPQTEPVLHIDRQPLQISGRFRALVRFEGRESEDRFHVVHFDRHQRDFRGPTESMRLPAVVADGDGRFPSSTASLEQSPLNASGWYVFGTPDASGNFVVQALAPRALLRAQPQRTIELEGSAKRYVRHAWHDIVARKGTIDSTALENGRTGRTSVTKRWQEGDQALIVHLYGGIGGRAAEAATRFRLYFGHFAYGIATVVHEPLADELMFDVVYYQVYTHNTDGVIAGALHWSRYMGDRQFGWAGLRPVCDTLLHSDAFCRAHEYRRAEVPAPLDVLRMQLDAMTARYRIGDGTGGTYVGAANNCAQDSNRALFGALESLGGLDRDRRQPLGRLGSDLRRQLQPFGSPRRDWSDNDFSLGTTIEDDPFESLRNAIGSWRVMLPRLAADTIVQTFLRHGASGWVLFTDQIGGRQDEIEPIAPTLLLR